MVVAISHGFEGSNWPQMPHTLVQLRFGLLVWTAGAINMSPAGNMRNLLLGIRKLQAPKTEQG